MNTNTTNTLTRSNKLTVKVSDGILQGDFFRTHKHLLTVSAPETGWTAPANANKTTERESFRLWLMEHADTYGILYDPTDRRTEANTRKATYKTEADVAEDAVAMVAPDIDTFVGKMPMADRISGHRITVESLTPKTHTSKGTDLSTMGIEDGKYASNGNLAWFDIEGVVTMDTAKGEIYQTIRMELVSGQLKKFRMTQTQWNTEVLASMLEAGVVTEEELAPKKEKKAKAEKSAKAETPATAEEIGLGDEDHEGLHIHLPLQEESNLDKTFYEESGTEYNTYNVEYQVKAGHPRGEFHVETVTVYAQNAKAACKLAKEMVQATKGYNAFNPTATRI